MSELGNALREARVTLNLSLDDIQEKTKIQKRYLLAIEEGEFDKLPGQFYSRAFIKSYAESVGLNPNELFETYQSEVPRTASEVETLPSRSSRETIRDTTDLKWMKNIKYMAMVVVVLAVAVGVWYLAQHMVSAGNSSVAHENTASTSYTNTKDLGTGKKTTNPSSQKTTPAPSTTSQTDNKTNTSGANTSQTTPPATTQQQLQLTQQKGSYYTYTLTGATQFVIDVTATNGNSWLGVNDTSANGKSYFSGNISNTGKVTSFQQDFSTLNQVFLKVGNVLNTTIQVNGQTLEVPKDPVFQHITIVYKKQ